MNAAGRVTLGRMTTSLRRLSLLAALVAIGALTAATTTAAPATETAGAAPPEITRSGVGAVKLGKTYKQLRRQKLVGKIRRGCELGGPNTRSAALRKPLRGTVDFTQNRKRKVTNITIFGGAKARGVGRGGTLSQIQDAFPNAQVERGAEETLGVTLVNIPRSDGGKFQFALDVRTEKVTAIGVPYIAVCE